MGERVVSLLPGATELVHALGCGDRLVGRSHECDHPPGVERLPVVSAPKWPLDGTSYAIDEQVRAIVAEGLGVYRVDTDALREAGPDLVVTQSQCEVCAVSEDEVERAAREVLGGDVEVVSLVPGTLEDVLADVRRVAAALAVPEAGERLEADLRAGFETVRETVAGAPRPSVVCLEWLDPLMGAGNWMPELVDLAGGRLLFGETGQHVPRLEFDALLAADPDVIVAQPCGFDLERTLAELPALTSRPGWQDLTAVWSGRVAAVDGHAFFNRPGPRLVETAEILAEIVHPDRADFGHAGTAWRHAPSGTI